MNAKGVFLFLQTLPPLPPPPPRGKPPPPQPPPPVVVVKQTQARKAITTPERPKPRQNGQKETNWLFVVMCLYFTQTHAWVSRVFVFCFF